eukprot:Hpha_TRINITY_DN26235_c0_g1::TRINITY_DN26235_c0_g1_i1::g.184728::m.184728
MPTPTPCSPVDPPSGPDGLVSHIRRTEGVCQESDLQADNYGGSKSVGSWSGCISGMLAGGTASVAGGLEIGGRMVADGIRAVVPVVEDGISCYAEIARSELDPVKLDVGAVSGVASRLDSVRLTTRTAAVASEQIATTVGNGCVSIGTGIASRLQDAGVVSQGGGVGRLLAATAGAVADVAGASFDATSAVTSATKEGVLEVVHHRYGQEVGTTVRTGMEVVGDVVEVGGRVRALGKPTSLARALGSVCRSGDVTFVDRETGQTVRLFALQQRLRYTVDSQERAPIRAVKYWAGGPAIFFPGEADSRRGANLPEDCVELLTALKALCATLSVPTDIVVPHTYTKREERL